MQDGTHLAPLTEPLIISCVYCNGIDVTPEGEVLRMVGWVVIPSLGGETEERRIVARLVMSRTAAGNLAQSITANIRRLG